MSNRPTAARPLAEEADVVVPGHKGSGRLLRRTFVVAFVLVSGGLLTSGLVGLFFRSRESVEPLQHCSERWRKGRPQDQRFCGTRENLVGVDSGASDHRRWLTETIGLSSSNY